MTVRRASLVVALLFLVVSVGTASAEGLWVLWRELPDPDTKMLGTNVWALSTAGIRAPVYDSRKECERAAQDLVQAGRGFHVCFPDTIDPRGPKGR
jgi:hypothetical protein